VVREQGKLLATSLLLVLLVVEGTDVVFALDSIPAILAITTDPFLVITSNIFAVVGLRALFFALAGFMEMFHYLNRGLAVILVFIGLKMLATEWYKIPTTWALGTIAVILGLSIMASLLWPEHRTKPIANLKKSGVHNPK
jgi:tellurite resistance protein TerC